MDPSALGRYLRESREAKELTLEDAVSTLHIRRSILESFERGEFAVADSTVQVRGLLRNYAAFLGLGEDQILQYYEAAHAPRRRSRFGRRTSEPELSAPKQITDTPATLPTVPQNIRRPRRRSRITLRGTVMMMISLTALAFIVYVIYDTIREPDSLIPTPTSTLPPPTAIVSPSATFVSTSTPVPPSPTANFEAQGFTSIQIRLETVQRTWLRIVVDNAEYFTGIAGPDQVTEFEAFGTVNITAANAAALLLTINGQEQAVPGERGQQAEIEITSSGINIMVDGEVLEPTATTSPTPEASPTPLPTATAVEVGRSGNDDTTTSSTNEAVENTLPTPTSIFANTSTPVATIITATAAIEPSSLAPTPVDTATPAPPTQTPTSEAILPSRETAEPSPTKFG